ncbi:hypothetical protein [Bartonella sp. DGB1]|uniref:cell division protein FtsL n=1 Tax=Bartonella sp. DGB1 TaxID=3239807 RepID=UPI003525AF3E
MRFINIVLIIILLILVAVTYQVKNRVQAKIIYLEKLQKEVKDTSHKIDLLKIDWHFLTQPERLDKLAKLYKQQLNLVPIDPKQIITINELSDLLKLDSK